MGFPKGQHFLTQAYLRSFAIPSQPEFIWLYQRGRARVKTNIINAAKQTYLYSFRDSDGNANHEMETSYFGTIDNDAAPVLERLTAVGSRDSIVLSSEEMEVLVGFIAHQVVRTPAFKTAQLGHMAQAAINSRHPNDQEFKLIRQKAPADLLPPELSDEEARSLWAEAMADVEAQSHDNTSWLSVLPRFAQVLFNRLWVKPVELVGNSKEYFLTCDFPVVFDHEAGIGPSTVLFPIASHRALIFQPTVRPAWATAQGSITSREISPSSIREHNHAVVKAAERFVFGAVDRAGIQKVFEETSPPQRFRPSSVADILGGV
jgi:hypothetical protein